MRDRGWSRDGWSGDGWSGDRRPRNRVMLIVLPLIVTMAVGLIVGIRLVSEKNATLRLSNTGQGTATQTSPATPAPASPAMTPSATTPATATPTPAATAAATNMSCVRKTLPAPSQLPSAATGCAGSEPGQAALQLGAGAARAAPGGAPQLTATAAAEMAGAANSAAAVAWRPAASRTAATRGV